MRRNSGGRLQSKNTTTQRKHRPDYQLIVYVGLLMMVSLVFMYTIGPQRANVLNSSFANVNYTEVYFVLKQSISLIAAITCLIVAAIVPIKFIKRYTGLILLTGLVASGLLFIFGNILHYDAIAKCSYGACRWFELGPLGSFQPAELLKFGMLLFAARFLARAVKEERVQSWSETLVPLAIVVGVASLFIVVIQKDLGTGLAMIAIVLSMLFVAQLKVRTLLIIGLSLLLLGVGMILAAPHRIARVATFLQGDEKNTDAQSDSVGSGAYHVQQAKIAIGSGGLFGVGVGNSVQATGYLPEAINDSLFAVMGETFGFVGLVALLILFTLLLRRLLKTAARVSDPWMRFMAIGVFGWLLSHIFLNISSMTGLTPLTGITLPLLSFGGTSMVFIAAAIGIIFHISRFTHRDDIAMKGEVYENSRSRRGVGRTRYTSSRSTRRS